MATTPKKQLLRASFVVILALLAVRHSLEQGSGDLLWEYRSARNIKDTAISNDGSTIVVGTQGSVLLFDRSSLRPLWEFRAGDLAPNVNTVAISSDGQVLAAGGEEGRVYIFGRANPTPIQLESVDGPVLAMDMSAKGTVIVVGTFFGTVYGWSRFTVPPPSHSRWTYTAGGAIITASMSGNGRLAAVGTFNHQLVLIDAETGEPIWTFETGDAVRAVSMAFDGSFVLAGTNDGYVYGFKTDGPTPLLRVATNGIVRSVALSADGKLGVAGSTDANVYFLNLTSGAVGRKQSASDAVFSVAISSDGAVAVAGTQNGKAHVFREFGSAVGPVYDFPFVVGVLGLSSDGLFLVSGGESTLRLYRVSFPAVSTTETAAEHLVGTDLSVVLPALAVGLVAASLIVAALTKRRRLGLFAYA